jgi:hypothetical protein
MQNINPGLQVGEISLTALQNALKQVDDNQAKISLLETQLTDLRNQRISLKAALWDVLKRLRSAVKVAYGDNSSQFEMVGGTRISEKKKTPKAANAQRF